MRYVNFFSVVVAAALLLAPATAMARVNFNFSLNLIECLRPMIAPPAPVPVVVAPVAPPAPRVYYLVPYPPQARVQERTIVKEYHHYYPAPQEPIHEIRPINPYPHY